MISEELKSKADDRVAFFHGLPGAAIEWYGSCRSVMGAMKVKFPDMPEFEKKYQEYDSIITYLKTISDYK